jgi:hypothetical protein
VDTRNYRVSVPQIDKAFKFLVTGGSVTLATVTILAKDLDVARNMANALFPGSDLSENEVLYDDRH